MIRIGCPDLTYPPTITIFPLFVKTYLSTYDIIYSYFAHACNPFGILKKLSESLAQNPGAVGE